jgi:hypothetical protein
MGDMADMQMYEDPYGEEYEQRLDEGPPLIGCRRCGEGGLVWQETSEGFRLYTTEGERHVCRRATYKHWK